MKPFSLPVMQCDDGCGRCCGPVLCKPEEYAAVLAYAAAHQLEPVKQGQTCPWYQGGRCAVHEVRPYVCRLFGHTKKMVCPLGYNRNISTVKERKLLQHYKIKLETARFLHEVFPDFKELMRQP